MSRLICLLAVACLLAIAPRAKGQRLLLEEAAREGQPAPGAPAATFRRLQVLVLAASGAVALTAIVEVTPDGGPPRRLKALFAGEPGRMTRVAGEGDVAPGLRDKPVLKKLELVEIDAAGRVLFNGTVVGRASGVESDVVWYGKGEFVGRVARSGEQMLGTPDIATEVRGESLAADGTIVLRARVRGGGDDYIYYVGRPDALRPFPDPKAPPPPGDGAVPFGRPTDAPRVNAVGQVLVRTRWPHGDDDAREAIWLGTPAGFRRVADTFTPVPALEGEPYSDFSEYKTHAGPPYALGDGGHVVFNANWWVSTETSIAHESGLWANRGGKFHLIARNDLLPGCEPNEMPSIDADTASIDATGRAIIFLATISKGEGVAFGTWLHDSGKLSLLMRSDRPIDGINGLPLALPWSSPVLSRDGRLVQRVALAGKDGDAGQTAVAVFQRGKGWGMLAAPGQKVEVAGKPAVLTSVDWASDINADGRFLLMGELLGRPGTGLYRVTLPTVKAE